MSSNKEGEEHFTNTHVFPFIMPLITGADIMPLITGADIMPLITRADIMPLITGADIMPLITGADRLFGQYSKFKTERE